MQEYKNLTANAEYWEPTYAANAADFGEIENEKRKREKRKVATVLVADDGGAHGGRKTTTEQGCMLGLRNEREKERVRGKERKRE